ncbi:hypothetical protein HYH03_012514 [Edaphochlamys debaryana]|uniref:WSC domain-containing protein n=1 Tax=Edaphochlamys debaryana TaxID=47281 RepID=A0A835XRU8_9CHLO|nr:hypothetical protein HYH03_012514 [Edaphochlamys debaryana]|eukprot:KAG2489078.1 hypothetical protein HYH03_012514 [Edaphochlamys debaryana]
MYGDVSNFDEVGPVRGIAMGYTDAYVDEASQTYYPRGVYQISLIYGDYPAPPGTSVTVLPRGSGPRADLPETRASLTWAQLGPLAELGVGSLQSVLVCCSDDNMVESLRLVRQLTGDTKLGLPVCSGYPVNVIRPPDFPKWAGLLLGVQQPIGSSEWVVASVQFVWAEDQPTLVYSPPPLPPSPRLQLPPLPPMQGASDWYSIAAGVVEFETQAPVTPMFLTKRAFPVAVDDQYQAVVSATRYNKGAVLALGSENMLDRCCGGALSEEDLTAPAESGIARMLLQGALWASWYAVKTGSVKVRVSHPQYINFARWLAGQRPGGRKIFLEPEEWGANGWVMTPQLFIRAIHGTLQIHGGKRQPLDLYIMGPDDDAYSNPAMATALKDYLTAGAAAMFLGPNPIALPGGSPVPLPGPTPSPKKNRKRRPPPLAEVIDIEVGGEPSPSPPPPASPAPPASKRTRPKRPRAAARRLHSFEQQATTATTVRQSAVATEATSEASIADSATSKGASARLSTRIFMLEDAFGDLGLSGAGRARPGLGWAHDGEDEEAEEGPLVGLAAGGAEADGSGRRRGRGLLQFRNGTVAERGINQVTGNVGIFFSPASISPVPPGVVSVVVEPRSDVANAELAAGAYVQYLQGRPPAGFNLAQTTMAISKARLAIPRGTPGSDGLYTLIDAVIKLGGTIPNVVFRPPSPPPPPVRASPPPPGVRASPPPSGGTGQWSYLGCYLDSAATRVLPFRLSVADRSLSVAKCGQLAAQSSLTVFGLQGSTCFGGSDKAAATALGKSATDNDCATLCGGDRTQMCGLVSATRVLLSLYEMRRTGR